VETSYSRIVDVWMQHPSGRFLAEPMFDSLRRWTGDTLPATDLPIDWTLAHMDRAGVTLGLLCAWWGPRGPLASNEEVASFVRQHPDRFAGVASVDLFRPMDAVRELRARGRVPLWTCAASRTRPP
jgi:predicted TIM-barrel fold metal-dependent hydrolase